MYSPRHSYRHSYRHNCRHNMPSTCQRNHKLIKWQVLKHPFANRCRHSSDEYYIQNNQYYTLQYDLAGVPRFVLMNSYRFWRYFMLVKVVIISSNDFRIILFLINYIKPGLHVPISGSLRCLHHIMFSTPAINTIIRITSEQFGATRQHKWPKRTLKTKVIFLEMFCSKHLLRCYCHPG